MKYNLWENSQDNEVNLIPRFAKIELKVEWSNSTQQTWTNTSWHYPIFPIALPFGTNSFLPTISPPTCRKADISFSSGQTNLKKWIRVAASLYSKFWERSILCRSPSSAASRGEGLSGYHSNSATMRVGWCGERIFSWIPTRRCLPCGLGCQIRLTWLTSLGFPTPTLRVISVFRSALRQAPGLLGAMICYSPIAPLRIELRQYSF